MVSYVCHCVHFVGGDGPGPKVIKLFSCSTQMSMKFVLLINLKLLTILNSFLLNIAEHENFSANIYKLAFSYLLAEKFSCFLLTFSYLLAEKFS